MNTSKKKFTMQELERLIKNHNIHSIRMISRGEANEIIHIVKDADATYDEYDNTMTFDKFSKNCRLEDYICVTLIYTEDFKKEFKRQHNLGEKPTKIFADAGLPSSMIGAKRIEKATKRWK